MSVFSSLRVSNLLTALLSSKISTFSTRFFHLFDPETAHHIVLDMMGRKIWKCLPRPADNPRLECDVMGMHFSNPIGMAAGFDKNAKAIHALNCLGFGFAEIGTVTPRQQPGNPRPRLFRLNKERAIINRMGFNSPGAVIFEKNLQNSLPAQISSLDTKTPFGFPVGINIGINKLDAEPLIDYPQLVERFAPYASYIAINLSSPNTPGLRDLQNAAFLEKLLTEIKKVNIKSLPVFIKLSPDLADEAFAPLIEICVKQGATGLILTNTTQSRDFNLISAHRHEEGGLSGAPLQKRSFHILKHVAQLAKGRLILISSGGIDHGKDILERLKNGADLVQIYSAFIYEGSPLLTRLKRELLDAMDQEKIHNLKELRTLFPLDKKREAE